MFLRNARVQCRCDGLCIALGLVHAHQVARPRHFVVAGSGHSLLKDLCRFGWAEHVLDSVDDVDRGCDGADLFSQRCIAEPDHRLGCVDVAGTSAHRSNALGTDLIDQMT